jgi:two-component system LytT family sensor kinase
MTISLLTKSEQTRHIFIWIGLTIYLGIIDPIPASFGLQVLCLIMFMFNYIQAYYLLLLIIFPKFLYNNRVVLVITTIGVLIYYFGTELFITRIILPALSVKTRLDTIPNYQLGLDAIYLFSIISIAAVSSFRNRYAIIQLKEQNEKEKVFALEQLNFLRDQFNSHMTFNFLNFCYAKVLPNSPEAAEAIELYTNMLNYSLLIKPDEKVSLQKEVTFITEFIGLQKCLNSKTYVEFKQEGELDGKMVLPRILVSFVENAFKHGQFINLERPIQIHLLAQSNVIFFTVKNWKDHSKKVKTSGIGKKNINEILKLRYEGKYQLEIEDTAQEYSSKLTLML